MAKAKILPYALATSGPWGQIRFYVNEVGKCLVMEFLDEQPEEVTLSFFDHFRTFSGVGMQMIHTSKFKKEMEGLFAFRQQINNLLYRFPCFIEDKVCVITHGFIKPGARNGKLGEWPSEQVKRAKIFRADYRARLPNKEG